MKSFLFAAFTLCFLSKILAAGEKPSRQTRPGDLEEHLLRWPIIGRPFYDLLLQEWGEQGWGPLDAHWKQLQVKEPHYALLRGLLAERQGKFEEAAQCFAEAGKDDWARYHRARLKAFTGEIAAAEAEMKSLAETTTHAWIFKQAALGLGEITLLQKDPVAAEKIYASLWDLHKTYEMRITLLEPLLSLYAEHNKARTFLEGLKQDLATEGVTSSRAYLEKEHLLFLADSLLNQESSPITGNHLIRSAYDPTNFLPLPREFQIDTLKSMAVQLVETNLPQDTHIEVLLSKAMALGVDSFQAVATIFKTRLRHNPGLMLSSLHALKTPDKSREALVFLSREISAGNDNPAWLTISLWLQLKAGGTPEVLRPQAEHIWKSAGINTVLVRYNNLPEGMTYSMTYPYNLRKIGARLTGPFEPSETVIWNLRGKAFLENTRARFMLGFNNRLAGLSMTEILMMSRARFNTSPQVLIDVRNNHFNLSHGLSIRQWLWDAQTQFGLDDAVLGAFAAEGMSLEEKVANTLLRGQAQDVAALVDTDPGLAHADTRMLVALNRFLWSRPIPQDQAESLLLRKLCEEAGKRLNRYILQQHPDWLSHAMGWGVDLEKVPELNIEQRDELLFTMNDTRIASREVWQALWEKIDPSLQDESAVKMAYAVAAERLALNVLPHPLWGLEWQSSLNRDSRLIELEIARIRASAVISGMTANPNQVEVRMDVRVKKVASQISALLSAGYGSDFYLGTTARATELRPWVARYPVIKDYLSAWSLTEKPNGDLSNANPEISGSFGVPSFMLQATMEMLGKSDTQRARFLTVLLNRAIGEYETASQLAENLKDREGPAGRLAPLLNRKPSPIATAPVIPTPNPEELLAKVFTDASSRASIRNGEVGDFFIYGAGSRESRMAVYDFLKKEIKAEPAYALKARFMAALARHLKMDSAELARAELLDLQLNADSPDPWLRRALSYVQEKNMKFAVDMFLESLRRTDFAEAPDFYWRNPPPNTTWVALSINAGRWDELVTTCLEAIEHTAPHRAEGTAATVLYEIMRSPGTATRPVRIDYILDTISKHQPHLYIVGFSHFVILVETLERAGQINQANKLARAILLSHWPDDYESKSLITRDGRRAPEGAWIALSAWNSSSGEIRSDSPIPLLLTRALLGESDSFIQQTAQLALKQPKDEHAVSIALVAHALSKPLTDTELKLADALRPLEKMRVASRLLELAPTRNVNPVPLCPMLLAGVDALLREQEQLDNDPGRLTLALQMSRKIESLGAGESLIPLLPLFHSGLSKAARRMQIDDLRDMALLSVRLHDEIGLQIAHAAFNDQFLEKIKGDANQYWLKHFTTALAKVSLEGEADTGKPYAALGLEVWSTWWQRYRATTDMSISATFAVAEALLAAGDSNQMDDFEKSLREIIRFDGGPNFVDLQENFKAMRKLLSGDKTQLPGIVVQIEPPTEKGMPAQFHWSFTLPQASSTTNTRNSFAPQQADEDFLLAARFSRKLFRALAGRFDLDIYAGEKEATSQLIAQIKRVAHEGSLQANHLPASGWLRGVLRNSETNAAIFSAPSIYSVQDAVLDSSSGGDPNAPKWAENWSSNFGYPVSLPVPISDSMDYLATSASPGTSPDASVTMIALDKLQQPIGVFHPASVSTAVDGKVSWLLRPSDWAGMEGWLQPRRQGLVENNAAAPKFIILTTRSRQAKSLAAFQLRPFHKADTNTPTPPLAVKMEWLANFGCEVRGWHLSETQPRAVFSGVGQIVAYDTSVVPWNQIGLFRSDQITGNEWVVFLSSDVLLICERGVANWRQPGYRSLKLDGATTFETAPRHELPFEPSMVELSAKEDGVVFAKTFQRAANLVVRTAWLDAKLKLLDTTIEIPRTTNTKPPTIAWWGDDNRFALNLDELLLKMVHTKDALVQEVIALGSKSLNSLPKGAIPGRQQEQRRWILKRPDLLIQCDQKTGALISAFKLPAVCEGQPIWFDKPSPEVFLQTTDHRLVRVVPEQK